MFFTREERPAMATDDWEWSVQPTQQEHADRKVLLRPIPYEIFAPGELHDHELSGQRTGKALLLNISTGGMLLLMRQSPEAEQVLKMDVPTPIYQAHAPTLAEVRWTRTVPLVWRDPLYFVGVKFLL
jgi:hypothetical protein